MTPLDSTNLYDAQIHDELSTGNWKSIFKIAAQWLEAEPGQPVPAFIQNIACLFINPPAIIRNKRYLESVPNKDWKAVLSWFAVFYGEKDQHNPYFQALNFILQPTSKKVQCLETALNEHPNNAELLFLKSISLRDKNKSIDQLKLAVESKPDFPAAYYLLGIFSLELNQLEAGENYLKQAISLAPDFLEAHYQLGSLYSMYKPDSGELVEAHFNKVIELDPNGGAGKDARKVLDNKSQPQYGQRIGRSRVAQRGSMSFLTILGISLLTAWLFSGPIARLFHISTPTIGIVAGLFVFIGLYSTWGRKR